MSGLAFVTILFVALACWLWWKFVSDIRQRYRPKLQRRAIVKGKRKDEADGSYHIGFEFTDSQTPPRKVYKVPVDDYMFLQEGNEVDVYLEDGNYRGFESD